MGASKGERFARDRSLISGLTLACGGLVLILAGSAFDAEFLHINLDGLVSDIGALLLVIGVLQWLFDNQVREKFFAEIRVEVIGNRQISESGICAFFEDSKSVDFSEHFLTSSRLVIGVNYSAKLIDNSIDLLKLRTAAGKSTTLLFVKEDSRAAEFLELDYNNPNIRASTHKIREIAAQHDPGGNLIKLVEVPTILRYSFVMFDSRIWVVVGTNGLGRRAVPGFFLRAGTPWFEHFEGDIGGLLERA